MNQTGKFRLGINYWPPKSAMYWWLHFDLHEVLADFQKIADAGFDDVRIFLTWEDFQPVPNSVSHESLERLGMVADAAAGAGLMLVPTLFTGHMSGFNWIPDWALDDTQDRDRFPIISRGRRVKASLRNWYVDEMVIDSQRLLARETASYLSGHPALWAWDLGNENSAAVLPPSRAAAINWLELMSTEIRMADPSSSITLGLHSPDLEEDRLLGPLEASQVCDFLSFHAFPIYIAIAEGPTDILPMQFLGLLVRWLGNMDIYITEFGLPTIQREDSDAFQVAGTSRVPLVDEDIAASFARRSLRGFMDSGFMGAMLWCYSDYSKALWSKPPLDSLVHERFFGLWRRDGTTKMALSAISEFVDTRRPPPRDDFGWIDIDRESYYSDPRANMARLYKRFQERFPPLEVPENS